MTRRRGTGHVYKRGRVWWVKWYDATGQARYRSTHARERAVAEQLLRELLGHRARGTPTPPDPHRLTIDALLEGLLSEYRANGRRSLDRADLSCRHLLRAFAGRGAATLTGADIVRYQELRQNEQAAPATINREIAALRRAYRLAITQGRLAAAPSFPQLQEHNVRKGFFEEDQLDAVCRRLGAVEADLTRFCAITGWRSKSEVFPLRWAQVDWAGECVRLEPGESKNREGRVFPFTPALRQVLERRRDETRRVERAQARVVPYVFHRRGQPMRSMAKSWRTACKDAGVPGRLVHDLRRTAVRNLERAGVPRSVAMAMVGHKTESVYRRYAIVAEADLRAAALKLAALSPSNGDSVRGLR